MLDFEFRLLAFGLRVLGFGFLRGLVGTLGFRFEEQGCRFGSELKAWWFGASVKGVRVWAKRLRFTVWRGAGGGGPSEPCRVNTKATTRALWMLLLWLAGIRAPKC